MQILIDLEELKKLESETGLKLKRLDKATLKWRQPPDWDDIKFDAMMVEIPEEKSAELFAKYRIKLLRK